MPRMLAEEVSVKESGGRVQEGQLVALGQGEVEGDMGVAARALTVARMRFPVGVGVGE